MLDQLSQLLPDQIHHFPDSNAWAANGPADANSSAGNPQWDGMYLRIPALGDTSGRTTWRLNG